MDHTVQSLKSNKAPGWDHITSEHIKNSGPFVKSVITWIMNSMIEQAVIPEHLKRGLLVPIPKPNKDSTVKDNNRGITLLTTLYKLFGSKFGKGPLFKHAYIFYCPRSGYI